MRLVAADDAYGLTDDEVLLAVSREEISGLANAITESLRAVDDWEYGTLVGLLPDEAARLRSQMHDVLDAARRPQ